MKLSQLKKYRNILILGYGKEGRSSERFLQKYCPNCTIHIADRSNDPNYLSKQADVDLVIKSPGISKRLVTKEYTTATNVFFANTKNIIIGITGTKGKSTTTSLIFEILRHAGKQVKLIGNIGMPMLEELLHPVSPDTIFICELSSYQLDDIAYSPQISIVVSLFPDHLNYHGDLESYFAAKENIVRFAQKDDIFIYNPAFPRLREWAERARCKTLPYENDLVLPHQLPLIGEHNRENIRGAITVARQLNIPDTVSIEAVQQFNPLPHRLQNVGTFQKITFYDDAISTTPESTIAAIKALKTIGTIFLGGEDRGYDFTQLARVLSEYEIRNIVLFPNSGTQILKALRESDEPRNVFPTTSMQEAVEWAYHITPPHTVCLLSTASPSYTLWKNFEEKGDQFQLYVKTFPYDQK